MICKHFSAKPHLGARDHGLLAVPSTFGDCTFSQLGPFLWNNRLRKMHSSPPLTVFMSNLICLNLMYHMYLNCDILKYIYS